jgi:hypothetical protein
MRSLAGKLSLLAGMRPLPADEAWVNSSAIFFLSTGRTGTTSLTRLLETSSSVHAVHEPRPQMFDARKRAYLEDDPHAAWITDLFRRGRARAIAQTVQAGELYAETSAFLSFFAPAIHGLMPNARFVFSHRHPGEFVRSGMRRGWYESHANDHTRLVPREKSPEAAVWGDWDRFEKICWLWSAFNAECLRCYEMLAPSSRMTLPSQEQWDDPLGSAEKIFRFVGLAPPSPHVIQSSFELRHNSQKHGEFDRFEDWSPQQRDTLYRIAGPMMERLGYSVTAKF